MTFTSTKTFFGYPCAHRQWRHKGHCALVHGYSRSFHFVFRAQERDACGFVVDFGDLDWLKDLLAYWFDHTLLLENADPLLPEFKALDKVGACALRTMPLGVGMEGTAQFLHETVDKELRARTKGRAWVVSVEARENEKNSAVYQCDNGFIGWS